MTGRPDVFGYGSLRGPVVDVDGQRFVWSRPTVTVRQRDGARCAGCAVITTDAEYRVGDGAWVALCSPCRETAHGYEMIRAAAVLA